MSLPKSAPTEYLVRPDPDDPRLTREVGGLDQDGRSITASVTVERPLTLFLNGREIVTMMTIGDYPEYLAIGYLLNQNMLKADDEITAVDYDDDIDVTTYAPPEESVAALRPQAELAPGVFAQPGQSQPPAPHILPPVAPSSGTLSTGGPHFTSAPQRETAKEDRESSGKKQPPRGEFGAGLF